MDERVTYVVAGRILLDHVLDPGGPIGRRLAALAVLFCEPRNANRNYGMDTLRAATQGKKLDRCMLRPASQYMRYDPYRRMAARGSLS
jgi:hypothetical protein